MALLIKKLAAITAFAAFLIAILVYASINLIKDLTAQRQVIKNDTPLILVDTFHAYLPGAIIICIGALIYSGAMYSFLYNQKSYKKIITTSNWTVLVGIVAIVIGGIGISYYWHQEARDNGYIKCGLLDKISTTKMHTSYWAKGPLLCNNKQVAKIISGTSLEDLKRANEYLEKQKRLNNAPQ